MKAIQKEFVATLHVSLMSGYCSVHWILEFSKITNPIPCDSLDLGQEKH